MPQLNTDFFDKNNKLHDDVREVLLKIKDDVFEYIEEEYGHDLKPEDVYFVGSLTGPNYDKHSDVDLHFVFDFDKYEDLNPQEILQDFLYIFSKREFNTKEYDLLGYPIEIYFRDKDEPEENSPGIYDLKEDKWYKNPDFKKVNYTDEMRNKANEFLAKANEYKTDYETKEYSETEREKLSEELQKFSKEIYDYRQIGLEKPETRFSFENLVFKLLRRNGTFTVLHDLMRQVQDDIYEVYRESKFEKVYNTILKTLV